MGRRDGSVLKGRWSKLYDCCRGCGTTERPHRSKGFCYSCLYEREKELAWPVGLRVWVAHRGAWRTGLIEARPNHMLASVRLDEGELVRVGFSHGHIFARKPEHPVPKSKRVNRSTGIMVLFERDERGNIVRRREGVWSSKAPACVDCGTTEKPHEAFGRCLNCYRKWKYRNSPGYAEAMRRRAKDYRIRSDYDAKQWERDKTDPRRRKQHREAALRYARKHSKWPVGAVVRTSFLNFKVTDRGCELARKPATGGLLLTGTIQDKTNTRALVQFQSFAAWVPYVRLELLEAKREAA